MNHLGDCRIALIGAIAFGACLASSQVLAIDAGCGQWDISGQWSAVQSNGTSVSMNLQQSGANFQGNAHYSYWTDSDGKFLGFIGQTGRDVHFVDGPIVGTVVGGAFEATVYWNNNTIGVYTGQIGPQGLAVGRTYDRNNPGTSADWHSDSVGRCQTAAFTPPAAMGTTAKPAPTVKLGRVPASGLPSAPQGLCEAARSAKLRNSPAAPGLERQCLAGGGAMTPPPPASPTPAQPPLIDPARIDELSAVGAAIAAQDSEVEQARSAESGAFYQLGFDIASGLFGDPALGAAGNTLMGPGSARIRDSLSAAGQRGFNASVHLHLARDYLR